ncbi:MAG: hypothetical protein GTO03_06300 [Planctomycetales bacterium]|nr:hypothetical protein [Planctomycetales bacterium]
MLHRSAYCLATLLILTVASGTSCPRAFQTVPPPAPVAFTTPPTLADVMRVVNQNRGRIQSLYATHATLNGTGFPALKANLAIASPRHVRLRAGLGVGGSELDLGSNQQLYWIWIKRSEPPAVYYGYHDREVTSAVGQAFPVQPEWLVEAIGMAGLDPGGRHQGPFTRGDGRLEVRTWLATPQGDRTRILVLDPTSGWILEQHLFGPRGDLIASAYNRHHQQDPLSGATLARRTDMHWPRAQLKLTLELKDVQINPAQLGAELWSKPDYAGYGNIDVTQPVTPAWPSSPVPAAQTPPLAAGPWSSPAGAVGQPSGFVGHRTP